ncbi:hypothetical protein MNBD_NITROSPINAE04-2325 [hydrothermal vent metagenome]|uniref:ABC-2 type transport system permease protein n=1 Tax=hydrothermal vent metagenome TaxID=652676 RepID=A0A3B1C5L9_9ZZZZ
MLFQDLIIVQRARRRLWINSIFALERRNLFKLAFLTLLTVLFVAGDYWFFRRILVYFDQIPGNVSEILVIQLLNLLCLTFFSMLVFSNIITSISTMYMSRDLDLLVSSPIPARDLFLSKYILTLINSSWMAVLFSLPVFVAYGQVNYAPWVYYALLPVLIAPFLIIPSGMGILLTMFLMRFFPAKRAHQVLSFVGLIFIAGLVMYFRFLEPEKFLGQDVPEAVIIQFVDRMKAPDYEWLPSSMMARALQLGVFGDWELFYEKFFALWTAALGVLGATLIIAMKIYYKGWSSAYGSEKLSAVTKKERRVYRFTRWAIQGLNLETRALMMKDVKLFWRDTGQWSQLFMLGALVIVYIFNIRNLPLDTIYLKNIVSVINIGLAGVVLAAVAVRFVFSTTSVEGLSFWVIKSSPISFKRFLWEKFFLYLIPLLTMAEILVIVSNLFLGVDAFVMAISAGSIALLTIGLTGLGVGMGAIYPKFDYESVAEIGVTSGAILYMIISLGYAGLTVMLCARPVYTHLYSLFTGRNIAGIDTWLSYVAMLVITAVIVYAPMRKGIESLEKIEI